VASASYLKKGDEGAKHAEGECQSFLGNYL